jgi:hypothetical protein
MRSCVFVFPFAGFVKQIARSMSEAAKTLGTIEDFWSSMHANITHSQEGLARNCASWHGSRFIFERWCIGGQARCDGETNLPKASELRRFIAETHRRHCEERSDDAIQLLDFAALWIASLRSQ